MSHSFENFESGDKQLIKRRAAKTPIHVENVEEKTLRQMISSGWSGLLQTLSLLFEVAPDEVTVASVLDTMIALTGPAKFYINPHAPDLLY